VTGRQEGRWEAMSAESRGWYVVYCKPHKDDFTQSQLSLRGIDVFAPKLRLPHYLERRKQVVPLFPNYLFVDIDPVRDFYTVMWTPGVTRFVSPQGQPAAVNPAVVEFLRRQADGDGVLPARADLRAGQRVEITHGPFDGLVGIIQRPPNARGRVKVLMQLLNRGPVKVDVPVQFVRTAWVV
jgi:transcriptional antiterminator RfaH